MENKLVKQAEVIRLLEEGQLVPPTEYRIFKFGKTDSTEGSYFFTLESAELIMTRYKTRGIECHFDFRHRSLKGTTAEDGKAAGWFDLEVREDGMWAINIRWTPAATEMISAGEYRYISPAFVTNEMELVIKLINVALTNQPATDNIAPLTMLEDDSDNISLEDENKLKSRKEKQMMKEKEHLALAKRHLKTYAVHASKQMMDSEDGEVKKMYSDHQSGCMKMAEEVKEHMKRMGMDGDDELDTEVDELEEVKTLCESIKGLTGKDKIKEQIMVLTAHKDSQETIKMLSEEKTAVEKELNTLKLKMLEDVKVALVDEAIKGKEKKLFPKQRAWALSQSLEGIKTYLEATPVLSINSKIEQPIVMLEETSGDVELTESDRKVIAAHKLDAEKFKQEKRKRFGK